MYALKVILSFTYILNFIQQNTFLNDNDLLKWLLPIGLIIF